MERQKTNTRSERMTTTTPTTKEPVCGMDVDGQSAAGSVRHKGQSYSFCSQRCMEKFRADPSRSVAGILVFRGQYRILAAWAATALGRPTKPLWVTRSPFLHTKLIPRCASVSRSPCRALGTVKTAKCFRCRVRESRPGCPGWYRQLAATR